MGISSSIDLDDTGHCTGPRVYPLVSRDPVGASFSSSLHFELQAAIAKPDLAETIWTDDVVRCLVSMKMAHDAQVAAGGGVRNVQRLKQAPATEFFSRVDPPQRLFREKDIPACMQAVETFVVPTTQTPEKENWLVVSFVRIDPAAATGASPRACQALVACSDPRTDLGAIPRAFKVVMGMEAGPGTERPSSAQSHPPEESPDDDPDAPVHEPSLKHFVEKWLQNKTAVQFEALVGFPFPDMDGPCPTPHDSDTLRERRTRMLWRTLDGIQKGSGFNDIFRREFQEVMGIEMPPEWLSRKA